MARVILVEARPRRLVDGLPETVRLAGGGTRPFRYDGEHWRAGIAAFPRSIAALEFDGQQLGGGAVAQANELAWAPATNAALAGLAAYYWADAPITVRIGDENDALPPIETAGLVLDAPIDGGVLRIGLADVAVDLKKPIVVDHYAGTGGIDGPAEWEGQAKPRAWGRCFNVPGKPIDAGANVWCFGDPTRAWQSIDDVRDMGVSAADELEQLAWQGSAAATLAALREAEAPEGGGVVCPSIACVKWWTTPAGDLHADICGETAGGYVETAPEIAARIAATRSTLAFAAGEVANAAAARSAPFGYRCADDATTAATALSEILGDVGLSWVIVGGEIVFRRWEWTAPVREARSVAVSRRATFKPVATRRLAYKRNQSKMARGDLAAIVLEQDQLTPRGPYDPAATYERNDLVQDKGSTWLFVAAEPASGKAPPTLPATSNAWWEVFAAAGVPVELDPNTIAVSEKRQRLIPLDAELERRWTTLSARAAGLDSGAVASARDAASTARGAWLSRRDSVGPPAWNNVDGDTRLVPPNDRAWFEAPLLTYRLRLIDLEDALSAYGLAQLGELEGLIGAADDGVLTRDEKQALIDLYATIVAEQAPLVARANERGVDPSPLQEAQNGVATMLGQIGPPAWNDTSASSPVDRTAYRTALRAYADAKIRLLAALDDAAYERESGAIEEARRAASDGYLTPAEKARAQVRWAALNSRLAASDQKWQDLAQPPAAAGVRDQAGAAVTALGQLLGAIAPPWTDRTATSPINGSDYVAKWSDAEVAVAGFEASLHGILPPGVQADLDEAIQAAQGAVSDGVFTPAEKGQARISLNRLLAQRDAAELRFQQDGQPAAAADERSTAADRVNALTALLDQLGMDDRSSTDPVPDRADYIAKWTAAITAVEQFRVALDERIAQRVDRLFSDGWLVKSEKWSGVIDWQALNNRLNRLNARYVAVGQPASAQPAQLAAFRAIDASYSNNALGYALGLLTPRWDDGAVDTPIPNPAQLQAKWITAEDALDAFAAAMLANPNADRTLDQPVVSRLDPTTGQATSRRLMTQFASGGAGQIYVPTNGNTNVGGTIQAGVPGSPLWAYTDPSGGASATIQVFSHTVADDAGVIAYEGGYVFGIAQGAQYWVYEDGNFVGGSRYYQATTDPSSLAASTTRRMIGSVFTPLTSQVGAGGGTSGGGGGGSGIRERYYDNQRTSPQQ